MTLDEAIGLKLKTLRETRGIPREIVALIARRSGLNWSRAQLSLIERGRRRLTLGEWLALPMILTEALTPEVETENDPLTRGPYTYFDLLPSIHDGEIELARGLTALHGILPDLFQSGGVLREARRAADDPFTAYFERKPVHEKPYQEDVSWNAARRFKVRVQAIKEAADRLWGHGLSEERDRQLKEVGNEKPRTIQAKRGHVTRELFTKLQEELVKRGYLKKKGGKRARRKPQT